MTAQSQLAEMQRRSLMPPDGSKAADSPGYL
jgi:hypothetical protein